MIFYRMNADWSEVRDVVSTGLVDDRPRPGRALLEEYVHPDDQGRVFEALASAIQAGSVFELEHRVRDAKGAPLWAVSRGVPVKDPQGKVTEWFGTAADVTARRRAEEALREKEARHAFLLSLGDRLRGLADAEEMTVAAAELLGRHLKVNRVAYGEVDVSCEYTTVRSEWTDGRVASAKGRYRLADFGAEVLAMIRRGEIRRVDDTSSAEGRESQADRALSVRAALAVPMLKAGRLMAVMGVHSTLPRCWTDSDVELVRDVGERICSAVEQARSEAALRASEAKYRTLFESMDEGFCLLELLRDEDGAPVDVLHLEANPAHVKHTGLDGVLGKKVSELLTGLSPERLQAYLREVYLPVLETGEPRCVEFYAKTLNRWLEQRIVRVGDEAQNRLAVLLTDVTLRRQAAEELRRNAERSAFMVRLADALGSLADPMEIQDAATRILGQQLGADRVHYAEVNGDKGIVRRDYTLAGTPSIVGVHELEQYPAFVSELALGRTLVCEDMLVDPRLDVAERAALSRLGVRATVAVPLLRGGAFRGILSAQYVSPHAWTLDEVELVEETAERTWAATERAYAESALRETEERFRAIVQNVRDYAIFLTDARGAITEWPNGAARMLGYSAEEAVGQPASIFYCESDVAAREYARELADAARDGRAEREGWRVRKDGQRLWVNEIWTAVRDGTGKLVGFTKISRDLTEKRREEEALRQLAAANAYRIELADSLRVVSDPVDIQATAAALLGRYLRADRVLYAEVRGATSVVHRHYVDAASNLAGPCSLLDYPVFFRRQGEAGLTTAIDDVELDQRFPLDERAALVSLGIRAIVSVPMAKAGELRATFDVHHGKRHVWSAAEILHIEKTAERVWAAVEQARAAALLRESEERFRHALEIETVGVVFFDGSGAITHANDAFFRMTGYTREDLRARTLGLSAFTAPEARGERGRGFEVLEATGSMPACEQRCIRKDGSTFWGLLAAKRLSSTERVEFILDITERKRAEEDLAAAHAELEARVARRTAELAQTNQALADEVAQRRRAEEVRSDLLRRLDSAQEDERRRVARDLHDQVGQTLTALTLAVRATREAGPLPVEVSARLADVQRAAEELGREVHGLAVRLRPTALDDLGLHAALGQLLSEWSARTQVEVDCYLSDLEEARLPPDFEKMLYRGVQEALTNVARHSRAARTSVVVQRVDGAVVAVVEDDGIGFDVNAITSGRIGLLGLTERVTLAGGALDIESSQGKGTTVIARIPC